MYKHVIFYATIFALNKAALFTLLDTMTTYK